MKRWAIPSRRKPLLRNYASVLFCSDEWAPASQRYVFYLLLRPVLGWVKDGLLEAGFELQTPVDEEKRIYLNVKLSDPGETVKALQKQNVHVSSRVGGVRIAPHFYNTVEEAETLLEKVKKVA